IQDIKAYKPQTNSLGTGQVLSEPYPYEKARLIVKEMGELLSLDLVKKHLVTDQLVLTVGYDAKSLEKGFYKGEIKQDWYGKQIPKHGHGTIHLKRKTSSTKLILENLMILYERIVDENLLIRRINITACNTLHEDVLKNHIEFEQLDLFSDYETIEKQHKEEIKQLEKEKKAQQAILKIKEKYGKNAILKGMNLEEGATTKQRNDQVGGHKA
ncbi:MAG: DNA methylase, partial [Holdemanella sp.]|nr:DNA methylase [Holdemanella sp.]